MTQQLSICIPTEFSLLHQSDKKVLEAIELEIKGLKKVKQAIDEAAEILGIAHPDPVGD